MSELQMMVFIAGEGLYRGVTPDNIGVSVTEEVFREALEACENAGNNGDDPYDPETWIGQEDGETIWTW